MVLFNVGFLPGNSLTYDFLRGPGLYASVVLMLLTVDIKSFLYRCGGFDNRCNHRNLLFGIALISTHY